MVGSKAIQIQNKGQTYGISLQEKHPLNNGFRPFLWNY